MASISELACTYLALIPHNDELTVTKDKISALVKAAGVNADPLQLDLLAKVAASVYMGREPHLQCRGWWTCPSRTSPHHHHYHPTEEKRVEAGIKESDDDVGFGLF
ncbi:large ribosomal subunit protein P1-like [Lycaon pictus]